MILRIGTRGSKLALTQSRWVKKKIEAEIPGIQAELVKIKTTGDKILDSPLSKIGGKGLFVKEIEDALLNKDIDVAVHSMKDVPAELPDELFISSIPEREDPRDALISISGATLEDFSQSARVGTSSLRRSSQLLNLSPGLTLVPLRGNVDTRLGKLESGNLQAIILAVAGLKRLGIADRITQFISPRQILPAVGQGALGLETRRDDAYTNSLLHFLNHEPTEKAVRAERAFLKELKGSCQVPIAGFARMNADELHLQGMVAELDGSVIIKDEVRGEKDNPEELGITLAGRLMKSGADRILASIFGEG